LRNTLFWNLNYWDTASTLAGEVDEVKTTYPKALAVAMVAVVLSYFLPLSGDPDRFSYPLDIQLSYGQWLCTHLEMMINVSTW
jgi:uncharacterized membrane protein YjjP (DUF1212 family)